MTDNDDHYNDDHYNDRDTLAEEDTSVANNISLREETDYYVENGLMVFTAHFLRQRGYCCESGCRHCPYGDVAGKGLK
jgi:hypothetical protein